MEKEKAEQLVEVQKYENQYSEEKFWDKVAKVAKKAGIKVIYAALLLYYALQSSAVSAKEKAMIIGALGYFILPVDIVNDLIPGVGYLDDTAILVAVVKLLIDAINQDVTCQAKAKLSQWFGSYTEDEIKIA